MPVNPTPKVHSQYGAPMGRPGYGYGADPTTLFQLRRIRINSGGYDDGGAYGEPDSPCTGIALMSKPNRVVCVIQTDANTVKVASIRDSL